MNFKKKINKKLIAFSEKNLLLLAIFSIILFTNCGRFKVDKLKPKELISVPINGDEKSLKIPLVKDLYFGIAGQVAFTEERLVISEPVSQQIKIYQGDVLEVIISAKDSKSKNPIAQNTKEILNEVVNGQTNIKPNSENSTTSQVKPSANTKLIQIPAGKSVRQVTIPQLQVPGIIVAGNDEDFFVLNKTVIGETQNIEKESSGGFYKILHFNLKGQLLRSIGRKGQVELPFENILWVDSDKENRLWVLYRHLGEMILDSYAEGKLIYSVDQRNCVQNVFAKVEKEKEEKDKIYTCEFIYPFYKSNKVLMVGKIEKNSPDKNVGGYVFQNRVFKVYDLENSSSEYIFKNLNDPDDYPYLPYDNSKIIIWQTQNDNTFKFALYDLEGDLINNLQIQLPGSRTSWRNTWYSLNGNIYSTRIIDNQFKVYIWK